MQKILPSILNLEHNLNVLTNHNIYFDSTSSLNDAQTTEIRSIQPLETSVDINDSNSENISSECVNPKSVIRQSSALLSSYAKNIIFDKIKETATQSPPAGTLIPLLNKQISTRAVFQNKFFCSDIPKIS